MAGSTNPNPFTLIQFDVDFVIKLFITEDTIKKKLLRQQLKLQE